MPGVCEAIGERGDAIKPRARRGGTSQTVSVGDGLIRKPIGDFTVTVNEVSGLSRRYRAAVSRLDGGCCVRWTCHVV